MATDHTRSAILAAAERLYADRGFSDVPRRDDAELYWGLHFALAMSHHTIREKERLAKLSEGQCDLNDVQAIVDRVVAVSVTALTGAAVQGKTLGKVSAR